MAEKKALAVNKMEGFRATVAAELDIYVVRDPYSMAGVKWVILGKTFCGVRAVSYQPAHMPGVMMGVIERVILDWQLPHYPVADENKSLQEILTSIKEKMLDSGATPLAVQWIGEVSPFSEKEHRTMAEKLKTKAAPKAAAKPAAAAAAAAKPKGNAAGLEKARAARGAAKAEQLADKRKLVLTDKGKEKIKKNSETGASKNLAAMRDAKTVGAAISAGLAMADINYAEKSGTITVG